MHMIRTAIAGILALFVASAAIAQTFPTVPAQSVIGRLGVPGTTGPSQAIPIVTLRSQLIGCTGTEFAFPVYHDGAWKCSTSAAPLGASLNGTLNLTPLAASNQRGLNITTSGPASGSTAGSIYSNLIQGSWNNTLTGTTTPGTPDCQCWSLFQVAASTGPNFNGVESYGFSVGNVTTGPNTSATDLVGSSFGTYNNYAWPNSRSYGGTSAATVGPNGTNAFLIAHEFAASIANATAGAVPYRAAINLLSYETHKASVLDTAISIQGGNPGGQFEHVLSLNTKAGTLADALSTTGDFIYAQTAQTVGSIINVPLLTISDYVYNTKNSILTGAGVLQLGSTSSDGGLSLAGGSSGNMSVTWTHNGTPNFTMGAVSATWYLSALGAGANALQVAKSTNIVTIPTGLAVQGLFTSSVNFTPASNDGAALGTTALKWSDLFLAAGGVVNWNNGAATITESGGNLTSILATGKSFTFQGGDSTNSTINVNGGGAGNPPSISLGRVSGDAVWGVADTSTRYWAGAAAGDMILRSLAGRVILTTGYSNGGVVIDASDNLAVGATTASTSSTNGALKSAGGIAAAGAIWAGTYISNTPAALSSIACASGLNGARRIASDLAGTTFTYGATAANGGTRAGPIFCNGTNWLEG